MFIYSVARMFRTMVFVFTLLIIADSCRPLPVMLGKTPQAEPPYVRLRDVAIVHAKEVGEEEGFQGNRIVADTVAFARMDVTDFSDGQQTFFRLDNGKFGPRIAEGKINVYSSINVTKYGYAEQETGNLFNYIQNGPNAPLKPMKYRLLLAMIPRSAPASVELHRFAHTRTVFRLVALGSIVSMIGGTALAGNGVMKDKNGQIGLGMTMLLGGMGTVAFSSIPLFTNRFKLKRAIAIHNGVFPAKK